MKKKSNKKVEQLARNVLENAAKFLIKHKGSGLWIVYVCCNGK